MLAGIGSILPDLIDKPLGHIILSGSLDYGRIYAHSGLFLLVLVVVGIAYRRWKGSWILLVLAIGVISHLVLDSMWELPVTLFYPILGDFGMHHFPNYVEDSLVMEIENTYEWIFGIFSLTTLIYIYRDKLVAYEATISKLGPMVQKNLSLLLIVTGGLSLIFGALTAYNPLSMTSDMESNLIIGLAAFLGGITARSIWDDNNKITIIRPKPEK